MRVCIHTSSVYRPLLSPAHPLPSLTVTSPPVNCRSPTIHCYPVIRCTLVPHQVNLLLRLHPCSNKAHWYIHLCRWSHILLSLSPSLPVSPLPLSPSEDQVGAGQPSYDDSRSSARPSSYTSHGTSLPFAFDPSSRADLLELQFTNLTSKALSFPKSSW